MRRKLLPVLGMCLTLTTAISGCSSSLSKAESKQQNDAIKNRSNLVSLFLIKKNNLNNEISGEIYPLAFLTNGRYVDASTDVTLEARNNTSEDYLIKNLGKQSLLNAIKNFTVASQGKKLGEFNVDRLAVGQFTCSAKLIGQGKFTGKESLPSLFQTIPTEYSDGFSGFMNKKEYNVTWRSAIALSQPTSIKPSNLKLTQSDEARYRQDLLTTAKSIISQQETSRWGGRDVNIKGDESIKQMSVFDLDHDGKPEVFGTIRKGNSPANTSSRRNDVAYINLWLTYKNNQPQILSSAVSTYTQDRGRAGYIILGTADINGDGIEEVIVKSNGYESTSFGIYEYQGNQLKAVFNGAEYGC